MNTSERPHNVVVGNVITGANPSGFEFSLLTSYVTLVNYLCPLNFSILICKMGEKISSHIELLTMYVKI